MTRSVTSAASSSCSASSRAQPVAAGALDAQACAHPSCRRIFRSYPRQTAARPDDRVSGDSVGEGGGEQAWVGAGRGRPAGPARRAPRTAAGRRGPSCPRRMASSSAGQASPAYVVGSPSSVSTRAVPGRWSSRVQPAGQPGQLGGEDQPHRDRLAVPPGVALHLLDRVAEGVAVVEHLAAEPAAPAPSGLAQVAGDHGGLDPHRPLHQLAQHAARQGRRPRRVAASTRSRITGSATKPHLTTSASPATRSAARQGRAARPGRTARRPARGRRRPGSCPRPC